MSSSLLFAVPLEEVVVDGKSGKSQNALTRSESLALVASHTPICMSWEDINYKVYQRQGCKKQKKELHIIKSVSGVVKPGEMLAIIGGSGAGKSTLLDILALRKNMGEITGKVMFNGTEGKDIHPLLRRVTGYVTQEDILKETLTVRETLQFQAELRLDPKVFSKEQRIDRVNTVMSQLGIAHRADMRIGNEEKRGLSGGEKKRVAIGVQLVTDPSVLFLDEPTSGLDAYNSLAVIRLLRELCEKHGKTVITTIHQPRSTIYELFDQLLVLNKGQTVYFGKAAEATRYFDSIGFTMPPQMNPADYFIDVMLDPDRSQFTTRDLQTLDFPGFFDKSAMAETVREGLAFSKTGYFNLNTLDEVKPFATSMFKQFGELTKRHWKNTIRNPLASVIAMVQAVVLAFIIGSIFYQLGYISPAAVQGRVGVLFFVMINGAFSLAQATQGFIDERLLVNRERAAGVYSAGPYFFARTVVDVPLQTLQTLLFASIMYWMSQLNPGADRFFIYLGICIVNAVCAGSIYAFIGSFSPNATVGNILVPVVTVLFFLFAGFFINANAIPSWWIWVYYISWMRYIYPAMMNNEFRGANFTCAPGTTSCLQTGDQVLVAYGIPTDANIIWQWILVVIGMIIIFRFFTYLVIAFAQKEKR